MAWSLVVAATAGILLGLRFRVPALIATTAIAVIVQAAATGFDQLLGRHGLFGMLLVVVTLQGAYLLGLLVRAVWRRAMAHQN